MKKILIIFIILPFAVISQVNNSKEFNVITNENNALILEKVSVFKEDKITTDLQSIIKSDSLFTFKKIKYINNGVFKKNHWIKHQIVNASENEAFIFEFNNRYPDSLYFYTLQNKKIKEYPIKGQYFKQNVKTAYLSNNYAYSYQLHIKKNDTLSVYINAIVNDGPFRVVNKIYTPKQYKERVNQTKLKTTYLILLLGFTILVFLLSLVMLLFTKKRIYFYYIGFVVSIMLNIVAVNGLVAPVLIEKYLLLGNNYTEMLSYIQVTFILLYANHFLSLKENYNKIYRLIKGIAIINIIVLCVGLIARKFDFYYAFSFYFSKITLTIITLLIYFFSIYLVKNKNLMARYFVLAYTPLVLFVVYIILQSLNLVRFSNPVNWVFITFFEILILSIAMAHQYFLMMKANYSYQKQIIRERENSIETIIETQDNERIRIARDLHDGVVQKLGALILRSRRIAKDFQIEREKHVESFVEDLEDTNTELRNISHTIMPLSLEHDIKITDAIDRLLMDSFSMTEIQYEFEYFNLEQEIPKKIKITIYRVLQELINNIVKYSKALKVNIQLYCIENNIALVVEDNGIGIKKNQEKKGIGLSNIHSRVAALYGNVTIDSEFNKGTIITLLIPIYKDE